MAEFLIAVLLVVITIVQIHTILSATSELHKIKQSIKRLDTSLKKTERKISNIEATHNTYGRNRVGKHKNLRGELDLFHKDKCATVQAVFRVK